MCKSEVKLIETNVMRSVGAASITAPNKWVGDTVGVFIMATDYTSENPQPNLPHPPRKVINFKAGFTTADKVLA